MSKDLPKVIHIHSDNLNMDLRMNTKSLNIMTDDKILYNYDEWVLLSQSGLEVDRTIHNIKKIFGGDVCQVRNWEDGRAERQACIGQSDSHLRIGANVQNALF